MAEGFPERPYQHHYFQTQNENNSPIPDQQLGHQDAEDILNGCSVLSVPNDVGEKDQRTENIPSWFEVNKCDHDSCHVNGQDCLDDNLRAVPNSNICLGPENNLTPRAIPTAADPPSMNLPENPDQTQPKLVRTSEELNDFKHKPPSNHYTPNQDKIQNICQRNRNNINGLTQNIPVLPNNTEGIDNIGNIRPGNRNNINGLTQNIPVLPNNTEGIGYKLVKNCTQETLEYLNDNLFPYHDTNWKNIASIHKWDYQKISQFEFKHEIKAFKMLVLQKEFCTYTVKNLLDDLKTIQRQDILNDFPSKWS